MATSDTVVGIVGAIILTGAMVAVFYYENQTVDSGPGTVVGEGSESFTFNYEESETFATSGGTTLDAHTASLEAGGDKQWKFDVPAYAKNVSATIEWDETDDPAPADGPLRSGPDTFHLHIESPTGTEYDAHEDDSGELTSFHFHEPLSEVTPPEKSVVVRADSEAEARDQLEEATADAHGVGTWTAVVKLVDVANDEALGEQGQDTGNEYTITVSYEYWEPVLEDPEGTDATPQLGWDPAAMRAD